jgi:hypothetical protein
MITVSNAQSLVKSKRQIIVNNENGKKVDGIILEFAVWTKQTMKTSVRTVIL